MKPDRTARELLERLTAGGFASVGEAQLRTLQQRLKVWRGELAHQLVFGSTRDGQARSDDETGPGVAASEAVTGGNDMQAREQT